MARIQLRDTSIYLQDGLAGTAKVDVGNSALAATPVNRTTAGGPPSDDEVQVIAQFARAPSGGTYTLSIVDENGEVYTTGNIDHDEVAAAVGTAINGAMALYPGWNNGDISVTESDSAGLSDGTLTLEFGGTSVAGKPWGLTVIDGALLTGAAVSTGTVLGVDTVVLNTDDTDKVPVGARFTIAGEAGTPVHTVTGRYSDTDGSTLFVTVTPAFAASITDGNTITFLPQRLEIRIGEGDLTWTEAREFIYDLDRDRLDTVREGAEQPVELELNFVFEYVTSQSGQEITPIDALKRKGQASEWVSSSADLCEPYAVDLYAIHCVPCGTDFDQDFLFADFRWESLDYSVQDAAIAVSGRCNVSDVTSTRADFNECA